MAIQARQVPTAPSIETIEADLRARFGELIAVGDLHPLLGYPSAAAVRKAHMRGTLPVRLISLPHRRARVASTREVASWLVSLVQKFDAQEEVAHD